MPKIEMGKEYRTKSGFPVRVLAIDRMSECGRFPVLTLVRVNREDERVYSYSSTGEVYGMSPDYDLVEVKPEVSGWMAIYRNNKPGAYLYKTKEDALAYVPKTDIKAIIPITFREGDGLDD